MIAWLLAALLLQAPVRDSSARAMTGTGVIGGVVATAEDGSPKPLRRALVTITGTGIVGARQVVTDDQGRFAFDALAAGRFTLTSEKPAYLKTYYGSRRPGRPPSTPIALVDAQRVVDVQMTMWRGAVIDGTVRDEAGRPVPGAQVSAQVVTMQDGARAFRIAPGVEMVTTDDRGHYRIFGLPPGEYTVRSTGGGVLGNARQVTAQEIDQATRELRDPATPATNSTAPSLGRPVVFAPGVTDASNAQTFMLATGEEKTGVDVVSALNPLAAPVAMDLTMLAPDGTPLTNVVVGVGDVTKKSMWASPGLLRPNADGHVVSQQLSAGTYEIFGRGVPSETPATGAMPLWIRSEITLDSRPGVQTFVLRFSPNRTVAGQVRLSGAPGAADVSRVRLELAPVLAIAGTTIPTDAARVGADGSFAFTDVPAGRYRLTLQTGASLAPLSAMLGDRDVLDVPFEVGEGADVTGITVALTTTPTSITGTVLDPLGRPSPEYSVVVFAADAGLRAQSARRSSGPVKIASDGRYRVDGLPPGDYLLAVIVDADPDQLKDPSFLDLLAQGALPIRLTDGQKVVQDLKIGG